MHRLFTIKMQDLDHYITIQVVWRFNSQGEPITDQDQERLEAAKCGDETLLESFDTDIVQEHIAEIWMEWLGSWSFSVFHDLMVGKIGIQHEIMVDEIDRRDVPLAPDQCEIIEATVTIKEIGGSGLDTGWEVC